MNNNKLKIITTDGKNVPMFGGIFKDTVVVHYDDRIDQLKDVQGVFKSENKTFFLTNGKMFDKYMQSIVAKEKNIKLADAFNDEYLVGLICRMTKLDKTKNGTFTYESLPIAYAVLSVVSTEDEDNKILKIEEIIQDKTIDDNVKAKYEILQNHYISKLTTKNSIQYTKSIFNISIDHSINRLCSILTMTTDEQYEILAHENYEKKLDALTEYIEREKSFIEINDQVNEKLVTKNMARQKEMIIKEKIKMLNDELPENSETQIYLDKLDKINMSDSNKAFVKKAIEKLEKTPEMSGDYNILKTHVETIFELPWDSQDKTEIDLNKAKERLDTDHYGIEKVKTRILEYLAVMKLNDNKISPQILCLVGSPGVGKTSIVHSIAKAINRTFTKMTLGGLHDESEIRGHRKTYVGAMCGRIMHNLKTCGKNNPVFLLDEIDKIATDSVKGNPAYALLEVLDPEQNNNFKDNYIEIPFDLSNVLFIATANEIDSIPRPLYDRMEIINVESYTADEKLAIAKQFVLPKEIKNNGINKSDIEISDKVLLQLISNYTRESGVRQLQRYVSKLCRYVATLKVTDKLKSKFRVTSEQLEIILNQPQIVKDEVRKNDEIGVVNGLSWSIVGGGILTLESLKMKGKPQLVLTGNLMDVMKESGNIAYTLAKKLAFDNGMKIEDINDTTVYLNACQGAVKKDGPSAGMAMTIAIYSTLLDKKIRADFAMTGEISLRGKVGAIGGLKEKLYACIQNGIKNVIVPIDNKQDIQYISSEIVDKLNINYVENIDQAIKLCVY